MLQHLHIWITRRQSGGGGRLACCGIQESRRRSFQRLAIRARRRRRRSAKWAKEEMKLPFQDCIFFHFCVHTDRGAAGLPPPPAAATAAAAAAFACCTTAAAAAAAAATPPPPPSEPPPPPPPGLGTDWPKPNAPGVKRKSTFRSIRIQDVPSSPGAEMGDPSAGEVESLTWWPPPPPPFEADVGTALAPLCGGAREFPLPPPPPRPELPGKIPNWARSFR